MDRPSDAILNFNDSNFPRHGLAPFFILQEYMVQYIQKYILIFRLSYIVVSSASGTRVLSSIP